MEVRAKKLGSNIKKMRLAKGISQETLARQANLKLSNLAKLEGCFNLNPTLATLSAIANILTEGSVDRLLTR